MLMNALNTDQRIRVIAALVEANSFRSIERMTGIHRDTIMRLMVRGGNGCPDLMDRETRTSTARGSILTNCGHSSG